MPGATFGTCPCRAVGVQGRRRKLAAAEFVLAIGSTFRRLTSKGDIRRRGMPILLLASSSFVVLRHAKVAELLPNAHNLDSLSRWAHWSPIVESHLQVIPLYRRLWRGPNGLSRASSSSVSLR